MSSDTYPIGHELWTRGDRCQIISEPYTLHGAEWQDARTETGRIYTVPTPSHEAANIARAQQEWDDQQAGFRRLREHSTERD